MGSLSIMVLIILFHKKSPLVITDLDKWCLPGNRTHVLHQRPYRNNCSSKFLKRTAGMTVTNRPHIILLLPLMLQKWHLSLRMIVAASVVAIVRSVTLHLPPQPLLPPDGVVQKPLKNREQAYPTNFVPKFKQISATFI